MPPRPPRARTDAATAALVTRHMSSAYQRIHAVVVRIPRGHVMTYGDVAAAAGMPRAARVVGYAMRALEDIPWQRVLGRRNARTAQVSIKDALGGARQRQLLTKEGVRFSASGGVDLERFGWGAPARPKKPAAKTKPAATKAKATKKEKPKATTTSTPRKRRSRRG